MIEFAGKFIRRQKLRAVSLFVVLLMVFSGALTGCGKENSGETAREELSEEDSRILAEMEEDVLEEDEIQEAFEEELMPLDEEELEMLENATGDASVEDDSMVPLSEEEANQLGDPEGGEDSWRDPDAEVSSGGIQVEEDGTYTSKEAVAAYIHASDHLPSNYITKSEAQELGWDSKAGNLDEVAPGKSIGGDRFGNYEGMLPKESGRTYKECDIDFDGGYRNEKRIIYSNDGLIFYTGDHYTTFEQLY